MARCSATRHRRWIRRSRNKNAIPKDASSSSDASTPKASTEQTSAIQEDPPNNVSTPQFRFFNLPGEIRNRIYDLIIFDRLHPDFQDSLPPNAPIPIPISLNIVDLRYTSKIFNMELTSRLFMHGASIHLLMMPQPYHQVEIAMSTSKTRMHIRGTCALGTAEVLSSFGDHRFPYKDFNGIPGLFAATWTKCELQLLLRCCAGPHRCNVCRRYDRDAAIFDVTRTLNMLSSAWFVAFSNAPDMSVIITQEGNWLAYNGTRFLEPGDMRPVEFSTVGVATHPVEQYIKRAFPDVRMRIRVVTLRNPSEKDDWDFYL
ncbi:hypothetical protein K432DRAFT_359053 [Lepidopterella palustris CBS 459.81]|uniref:F-box domain-containing protein n=1 Tax=Lepidopterella palustris CBS 459.81 TaxID=1314670 RepID=A0A8E2E4V5_9PEZI|nr:hypothetical protein K432DRAFT_359053 [Lepidopterella palustris CBS 459.81]